MQSSPNSIKCYITILQEEAGQVLLALYDRKWRVLPLNTSSLLSFTLSFCLPEKVQLDIVRSQKSSPQETLKVNSNAVSSFTAFLVYNWTSKLWMLVKYCSFDIRRDCNWSWISSCYCTKMILTLTHQDANRVQLQMQL